MSLRSLEGKFLRNGAPILLDSGALTRGLMASLTKFVDRQLSGEDHREPEGSLWSSKRSKPVGFSELERCRR